MNIGNKHRIMLVHTTDVKKRTNSKQIFKQKKNSQSKCECIFTQLIAYDQKNIGNNNYIFI